MTSSILLIRIVISINLGIFELSLAIFGAVVIIVLTMIFIKISKNEVSKLMSSEAEMSTARNDEINV
jgi:hypothetical protein